MLSWYRFYLKKSKSNTLQDVSGAKKILEGDWKLLVNIEWNCLRRSKTIDKIHKIDYQGTPKFPKCDVHLPLYYSFLSIFRCLFSALMDATCDIILTPSMSITILHFVQILLVSDPLNIRFYQRVSRLTN